VDVVPAGLAAQDQELVLPDAIPEELGGGVLGGRGGITASGSLLGTVAPLSEQAEARWRASWWL